MTRLKKENKFLLLLIAIGFFLLVLPFIQIQEKGTLLFLSTYTLVLIAALYSLKRHRRQFIATSIMAVLGFVLNSCGFLMDSTYLKVAGDVPYMVFNIIFVEAILHDIFKSKEVTADSFCGAICAYIMIAIFFASLYRLIEFFYPDSFNCTQQSEKMYIFYDMLYFSFMTLTTIGYGDIVPITMQAKAVVILEGITGVFYIGILVSHLVGSKVNKAREQSKCG